MSVKQDAQIRRMKQELKQLKKNYESLLDQHADIQSQIDSLLYIKDFKDTHRIVPQHIGGSEIACVAVASDWHIEERIDPRTVNNLNEFNLTIARRRADHFFEMVVRMVKKEQRDNKVNCLVLALLGDFITGSIHLENLETCTLRPIEAIVAAQEMISSGIEYILANIDLPIYIPCCNGNHSRITRRMHASTQAGNSLEHLMYHNLANRFSSERVTFDIADGYHLYVNILGHTVRFHHGDAVMYYGGVGGLTIPMNKAIAQWDRNMSADITVNGHFHTYMSLSNFVVNGSLIGYSPYALRIKGAYEHPTQAFFVISERYGKTTSNPIICQ